jgi:fused signal recognition particle receptor
MGVLAVLGVFGTLVYYFFRFAVKTDFDKDLEQAKGSLKSSPPVAEPRAPLTQAPPTVAPVTSGEVSKIEPAPLKNIDTALKKTRETFFSKLKSAFSSSMSQEDLESLEEVLYTSDLGTQTVQRLMAAVDDNLSGADKRDVVKVTHALKQEMARIFSENETPLPLDFTQFPSGLQIWLIVGVNGAGKTTTIGKLAHQAARAGKKVMVAAGDTFRAAAGEQLKIWSERAQVEIFSPADVKDPSAVAFDACASAKAKNFDLLLIDTAGRLHTQSHLMSELEKINRVVKKVDPSAPHAAWLVIDANSGQNALIQAKQFHETVLLSGVVLTKLDGSAKGGVAVGLSHELHLPIAWVGVGEGIDDLKKFEPKEFVDSIL